MARYDIAIIGTGPAGLEAALTAKNRNQNFVLYGTSALSPKMQAIDHPITNYLGLSKVTGKEMASAFLKQMKDEQIEIEEVRVTAVYAMGDYFALQLSDGEMSEAAAVILAAGVTAGSPYPGEEKFLGRGVSYCATCDAPLYKGRNVTVVSSSKEEEKEAEFLGEVCNSVEYIPLYKEEPVFVHENIHTVYEKPLEITGDNKVQQLVTDKQARDTDCVFILREAQFPDQLVPGLQIEKNAVKTGRDMSTNIPGLYAAGDITGLPYQFIKSAGEGNIAAISASLYSDEKKRSSR